MGVGHSKHLPHLHVFEHEEEGWANMLNQTNYPLYGEFFGALKEEVHHHKKDLRSRLVVSYHPDDTELVSRVKALIDSFFSGLGFHCEFEKLGKAHSLATQIHHHSNQFVIVLGTRKYAETASSEKKEGDEDIKAVLKTFLTENEHHVVQVLLCEGTAEEVGDKIVESREWVHDVTQIANFKTPGKAPVFVEGCSAVENFFEVFFGNRDKDEDFGILGIFLNFEKTNLEEVKLKKKFITFRDDMRTKYATAWNDAKAQTK
eukprot:TRINITY_DN702_c0_g1_i1.p1 TRINITY_DN702_c0_g1~~TRINITY_DN702_c0_g1_i1.p1  ORF type:complete len:277 (-),score=86.21 TRINITY_DN702_c0_g1_i1:152-931(-)